jgi:hypothetical protein
LRERLRRLEADPERARVLRVVVDRRLCGCGGWLVEIRPADLPARTLHTADADELAYALRYELDVIMSETGRDVAPVYLPGGDPPLTERPER